MIRILVVDDHPVVREGLVAIIEAQDDMSVVGEAGDGAQAIAIYKAARPDVVLMDLAMPGVDGVQAIEGMRAFDADARV
ncbi:MAG TPA: response regulator transcription factor, partial [Nitrolancea sp.]|nr:response regulator transcription factor [Nitrolancea sp.]